MNIFCPNSLVVVMSHFTFKAFLLIKPWLYGQCSFTIQFLPIYGCWFVPWFIGMMGYFDEGCGVLWWGLCVILKRVVWYIEDDDLVLSKWGAWFFHRLYDRPNGLNMYCVVAAGFAVKSISKNLIASPRVFWLFSEHNALYCGTGMRYFEEGYVLLWRGWCGALKRDMCYFEEGGVVLWRGWCGTLKRLAWYFEEGVVVLWRGWRDFVFYVIFL